MLSPSNETLKRHEPFSISRFFTKTNWFLIEFPLVLSLHDIVPPFNFVPSNFRAMASSLQASLFSPNNNSSPIHIYTFFLCYEPPNHQRCKIVVCEDKCAINLSNKPNLAMDNLLNGID